MALSLGVVCARLGYSRRTVYRLIRTGQISAFRTSNARSWYRVTPEALEDFIRTHDATDQASRPR